MKIDANKNMDLNFICYDIPENKILNFAKNNNTSETNYTINFLESWVPAFYYYIKNDSSKCCGVFIKMIVELSKMFGYK